MFLKTQVTLENFIKFCMANQIQSKLYLQTKSSNHSPPTTSARAVTCFFGSVYVQNRGVLENQAFPNQKIHKEFIHIWYVRTDLSRQSGLINGEWSQELPQIVRILFWIWISNISLRVCWTCTLKQSKLGMLLLSKELPLLQS